LSFRIGEIVADYEITGVLGSGGMSTVYQVRHLISNRAEAMKVLLPNLDADPELAERFMREIRMLASLSHPGIAMLHTAFRERNQLLMVMELVKGETVSAILRRKGLGLYDAVTLTIQTLDALAHAHQRHVIHRDIKPSNIMLTPNGQTKLLDFGIARAVADVQITQKGTTLGSFHYMSPEQVRDLPVDHRTDIYSAGVTLYEMATGKRPFTGTDSYAVMRSHVEHDPAPPESINPRIPRALSHALARALMKNPAERFQTATAFLESLKAIQLAPSENAPIVGNVNVTGPTSTPTTPMPKPAEQSGSVAAIKFDPAALHRLTLVLADHMGPIAAILVKRAAKTAASWEGLCHAVASEVPESDRAAFLASVRQG